GAQSAGNGRMERSLDLYLLAAQSRGYLLFGPSDMVETLETASDDRIRQAIGWLVGRPNRLVAWLGRTLRGAHQYYVKLEDRIDPQERVLKALACVDEVVVCHGPSEVQGEVERAFTKLLQRQRRKHIFWFVVDGLVSSVVIVLTPIL